MKKLFYIIPLLIAFFSCTQKNSQNETIDSGEDSLSIYLSKANDFNSSFKTRKLCIQKAFVIIQNQPNDSLQRLNLFRIANRYYNLNDWENYQEVAKIILEKSVANKDTLNIAKAYSYLGDYYGSQGISDSAFLYYFKSEKIYLKRNDNLQLAKIRLNKAMLQQKESDYSGSEISALKALRLLKGEKTSDIVYELNNLLGNVYNELGEYEKSIEFQNKALEILYKDPTPIEFQSRATSMNNMGLVYQNLNKDDKAIYYFQKGLENEKDLMLYKPVVYAMLLDNLGYSRFKLNINKGLPELFYESLKLRDSLHLTIGIIITNIHLSEYFASKNDTLKARKYSKDAITTARNSKNNRNLLLPLRQMAIIEPERASQYNKEYIHINDSLQKADRNIADKFSRIEYETDEIKEKNTNLTAQNRNLVYIFGSILIVGMFLYIIKAQKSKNRELLFKQSQQKANEEIYNLIISQHGDVEAIRVKEKKRVSQELHDGVLGRMFGVRMNLDSLNNSNDETSFTLRNSYLTELKNIEQDIREISHDLNREKSELINNFVAIVDKLLEDQKKTFNAKLISSIDPTIEWEKISNTVKVNLYRIIQESLQNTNKYADANTIRIEFKKDTNNILLEITDDGNGFNKKKAKKGIGIQNMISRINECNGTFEIKSKKGEGTSITVSVPI